jgi:hypothetical protein
MLPEPDDKQSNETPPEAAQTAPRQCTVMFYFASDNPLAPGIVSQLKAIKDAGFHKQVNVIARFDPHDSSISSHIFDVNVGEKAMSDEEFNIGFDPRNPFVRTLVLDKLWSDEQGTIRRDLANRYGSQYKAPIPKKLKEELGNGNRDKQLPNEPTPEESLRSFLEFCATHYPAEHYMLFILGHGVIVGNEIFLFDEHTDDNNARSLTLAQLRGCLEEFGKNAGEIKGDKVIPKKLDLLSFHSCSMSGLEVAYELKDTARYMLASEGPAFVGSWPYRQMLVGLFNHVQTTVEAKKKVDSAIAANQEIDPEIEAKRELNVDDIVRKMFAYCFFNSYDFQLAGYSFDLCLTDLERVGNQGENGIKVALANLVDQLKQGLKEGKAVAGRATDQKDALANMARDLITLSHLQAQSYFEENFTDLGDFCFCLKRKCEDAELLLPGQLPPSIGPIKAACDKILTVLASNKPDKDQKPDPKGDKIRKVSPIIRHAFAGPAYQYSSGLSMYFPWSLPEDNEMWNEQYGKYMLSEATGWKEFLEEYFETTKRQPQAKERENANFQVEALTREAQILEDIGAFIFNEFGQLKDFPSDRTGGDCSCSSIKNYPRSTRGDKTDTASRRSLQSFRVSSAGG